MNRKALERRALLGGFPPPPLPPPEPEPEPILPEPSPAPRRERSRPARGRGRLRASAARPRPRPLAAPPRMEAEAPVPEPTPDPGTRIQEQIRAAALLLLLPGPRARASGWAAGAAIEAASRLAAGGQGIVLADLDVGSDALARLLGVAPGEGAADVLLFGVSLRHAAQTVPEADFLYLPTGELGAERDTLFRHPRWPRLLAEARRRDLTLLAYLPPEAEAVHGLAPLAGGALLLADPVEEELLLHLLPAEVQVLAVVAPVAEPEAVAEEAVAEEAVIEEAVAEEAVAGETVIEAAPVEEEAPAEEAVVEEAEATEAVAPAFEEPAAEEPPPPAPEPDAVVESGIDPELAEVAAWLHRVDGVLREAEEAPPPEAEPEAPVAEVTVPETPPEPMAWPELELPAAETIEPEAAPEGEETAPAAEPAPARDEPAEAPPPRSVFSLEEWLAAEAKLSVLDTPAASEPLPEPESRSPEVQEWLAAVAPEAAEPEVEEAAPAEEVAQDWTTLYPELPVETVEAAAAETLPPVQEAQVVEEALPAETVPEAEALPAVEEIPEAEEIRAVEEPLPVEEGPGVEEPLPVEEAPSVEELPPPEETPPAEELPPAEEPTPAVEPTPEEPPVALVEEPPFVEEPSPLDEPLPVETVLEHETILEEPAPIEEAPLAEEPEIEVEELPPPVEEAEEPEIVVAVIEPLPEPQLTPLERALLAQSEQLGEPLRTAAAAEVELVRADAESVAEAALPEPAAEAEPLPESAPEPETETEPVAPAAFSSVLEAALDDAPALPATVVLEEPEEEPVEALAVEAEPEPPLMDGTSTVVHGGPIRPVEAMGPRYGVPRVSEGRDTAIRVAAVLILAYWAYYIGWRWTQTLNPEALWFSIPLVLAETWGFLTACFLAFTTWRLNHRAPVLPPQGLDVDVFITAYDEPLEVIRRTAISAREIRYPHRTFVLDDGRREEVRSMAEELGIGYLRRDNNEHAKAGNLNHALGHTTGDFILQLDADHAPLPHILDRLLGYFEDPEVAFVQTPQDFYNTDSFTTEVSQDEQRIWEEQRLFFSVIQPGKDSTNSAFFCGSCAVIRREALEEIGGFSTESITEDIETSLLLHSRGWKSVYLGESLAYGLAAGSAEAFHTQHMRWAQGGMQVLRRFNPLTYPGLSLAQRIGYFYSLCAYVGGLQKLIFYTAPIVFFLTGALPIRALDAEFLARFVPYLVLSIVLMEILSRGQGFTWIAERYQMAKFWTYTRALLAYFTRRPLRFRVTPKGPGSVDPATYAPHILLMVVTAFAVNWATLASYFGWVEYSVPGWRSLAFQLNFLWALVNFVLAAYVVRLSLRLQQQRQDHRFADRFPIDVRTRSPQGRLGDRQIALTEDLNSSGISFRSVKEMEVGTGVKLTLPLSTREVTVNGTIVHVRRDQAADVPIYVHGVEFHEVPLDVRDAIEIHCAHHAVPIRQMQLNQADVFTRAQDWMRNARGEPRRRVRLPTWVLIGEEGEGEEGKPREAMAFLEEISPSGARLIMNEPIPPGTRLVYEVPGTQLRGEGRTVFSRALETPIGVRFAVGVRREINGDEEPPPRRTMTIRKFWRAASATACLMLACGGTAAAQLQPVFFGSAEADTEEQSVLLLGAALQFARPGLAPVASVLGYRLTYPFTLTENITVNAINPAAGLRYQWPMGAVQGTVGYLFLDEEVSGGFGAPGGAKQGVTTAVNADYWGTGERTAQAIASFNWADQYLWGRVRGAQRVFQLGGGDVRLGAEVIGQGLLDTTEGDYRALQFGPVLEFQPIVPLTLVFSGGVKTDNLQFPDRPEFFPYFKFEFVLVP